MPEDSDDPSFDRELFDEALPVRIPASPLNEVDAQTADAQAMHGFYPVTVDKRWHAGIHLDASTNLDPIRAIADGVVVAMRYPKTSLIDGNGNECDNGFVLLKHETEIGARLMQAGASTPSSLKPVKFTYFSLYMHLRSQSGERQAGVPARAGRVFARPLVRPEVDSLLTFADPASAPRVYRREVLGYPGKMYGRTFTHCEVFTTDDQLQELPDTEALVRQRRSSDRLPWGKLYFYIPAGTDFLEEPARASNGFIAVDPSRIKEETKPSPTGRYYDSKNNNSVFFPRKNSGKNKTALVVEMWFDKGDRFHRVLKEMADGETTRYEALLADDLVFRAKGYEYTLYAKALRMYPDGQSAGCDLLRFGRVVGVDSPAKGQKDAWLAAPFGTGPDDIGYLDLAAGSILKFSDADMPHFAGWKRFMQSGAHSTDGTVDVEALKDIIATTDTHRDGITTDAELVRHLHGNEKIRRRLRHLICQAPSEWDSTYNDARYGSLQQPGKAFSGKPEAYARFNNFISKFQFWRDAKPALGAHGVGSSTLWYFHPLQFVSHFKKANWLSLDEMVRIFPLTVNLQDDHSNAYTSNNFHPEVIDRLTKGFDVTSTWGKDFKSWVPPGIASAVNWTHVKYGICGRLRQAHFWSQALQESSMLNDITENGHDSYFIRIGYAHKNGNRSEADAINFTGRGLIQITGFDKYQPYSKFRAKDFVNPPNFKLISNNAFEACDSAGWFYSYKRPATCQAADAGFAPDNVEKVTRAVNGAINGLFNRQTFFSHINCALGDQVENFPSEYQENNIDSSMELRLAKHKTKNNHSPKRAKGHQ